MSGRWSWRKALVWGGALGGLCLAVAFMLFYTVIGPRLGNQNEIEGLAAPSGLDWNEPSNVDSLLGTLARLAAERPLNAGIAIGVTRAGTRHVVARGVMSKDDPSRAVTPTTVFEIGSITKTFTGVALAQASTGGALTLDQPIGEILPDSIALPAQVRSISVGALATHTAGLPSDPPSVPFVARLYKSNPYGDVTADDAFESLRGMSADSSQTPSYSYSNFGFMVLGELLEYASGQSYAALIEQHLAGPLGMGDTWVHPPVSELPRLATGHRLGRTVEHWYDFELPGAAGVVSTVPDMLTYLEAHLHPETTSIPDALGLAARARVQASATVGVGLGWHVYTEPGLPLLLYHNGSTMGFRSYVGVAPELDLGIVVLGNSRDPTINAIGRLIMRTLAGIPEDRS